MKYLNRYILLTCLSLWGMQSLYAQPAIDANRMNRDINIMENILREMFKTRWEMRGTEIRIAPGDPFRFRSSGNIRGTYLPEYGVIFTIAGGSPRFVVMRNSDNENSFSYSFRYSDDDSSQREVNEETVTNRIKEFLREYGSTIGQLQDDDRIMVIYNTAHQRREIAFFDTDSNENRVEGLPIISVVAQKSDLQDYRSGSISEEELDNRFSVSTVRPDAKEQLDLKVMANIFETALNEQEGKGFRIRGSVNYLHLDNFGALFFFDARYGSSSPFFMDFPKVAQFSFGEEEERARVEVIEERLRESEERRKETAEEIKKSYDAFVSDIKEYLIDYGRTLNSVTSDQHIMISATVFSTVDEVPERIDLQVEKSVLESVDQGSMSRENAMDQIVVREY